MKTLSRRLLCQPNKFLSVEIHEVELPDGRRIDDWPWVITPDYANILARTTEGRFLIFRQSKYAIKGDSLAPMGGYIEPDEAPLAAAQRELLEETGYIAPEWHSLGSYPVDANRGAGTAHFFLALDARQERPSIADDLEPQQLHFLTQGELVSALKEGQFKILPWAAMVALGLQWLQQKYP